MHPPFDIGWWARFLEVNLAIAKANFHTLLIMVKKSNFFQTGVKFPKSSPIYLTSKANKTIA